ncbi:MAG: peptidoglycan-binding protein [Kofleriaceae bacterium]
MPYETDAVVTAGAKRLRALDERMHRLRVRSGASMRVIVLGLILLSGPARADDCERVAIWRDGTRTDVVCRDEATRRGLTVIDLGSEWTPSILAAGADGAPAYRATYLALARERFAEAGLDGELATRDRYLELYGIAPTLEVVRTRLADAGRHACHDAAGDIGDGNARIVEESIDDARARLRRAKAADARVATIRLVQAHLRCDELFDYAAIDGAYTWQTTSAVERFQRGAMILPTGTLDEATREAFRAGSRELDFRAALRVLRERVVSATGWIEDGSAGPGEGTVLGRSLVPSATWSVRGHEPLENAAPDLISPATESVARALGWMDADTTRASLDAILANDTGTTLVGVELPPPPAYHAPPMQIEIEIDRGDVWRDPAPRRRYAARRPALIVYAVTADRRVPLARWPTTIGGWQKANVDGEITRQWKESPVGRHIWRDLYIGPSWLPPTTTPDRELLRRVNGRLALAREQLGPSYRAAFGMVAFIHLVEERSRDKVEYWDQGIRTHGTGSLASLANGVSHGCHRLLGYHVVRLAELVLAHHPYVRHGDTPTYYRRVLRAAGARFPISIDTLGYRIELVPPIEVTVLPGRIHRR